MGLKKSKLLSALKNYLNLGESTSQDSHLNELLRQVWNKLNTAGLYHFQLKEDTLRFGANVQRLELPEDFNEMLWITDSGDGTTLDFITEDEWGREYVGTSSETESGDVTSYRLPGPNEDGVQELFIWKKPSSATTVDFAYYSFPEDLDKASEELNIPDSFADLLYDGVASIYYNSQPFRAQTFKQRYREGVERLKANDKRTKDETNRIAPDLGAYMR